MSQDLWSKLEVQFEEQSAKTVEIPQQLRTGPKKRNLKESIAESYLNGFLPTVLLCALGFFLTGVMEGYSSGIGAEVVLLLPLAWLLRPILFKGTKPSPTLLLSAPFLIGGFTEIFGVGTHLLGRLVKSELTYFDEYQFLQVVQDHIEGYLSFSHFGLYLLAGVLLMASYGKVERAYYWFDLKPTHRLRVGLAQFMTFVLPGLALLTFGYLLWQHPWTEREEAWLTEMKDATAAMPVEYFKRPSKVIETQEFGGNIQTMKPPEPPKLTKEKSLVIERETLERLPQLINDPQASKEEVLKTRKLMKDLAEDPDNLEDPSRWALAATQLYLVYDNYSPYNLRELLIKSYLPHLATAPLSEIKQEPQPWNLETTRAKLLNLKLADYGLHRFLIRRMGWQTLMTKPRFAEQSTWPAELRPMTVFGLDCDTTPLKVYARWKVRPVLTWWLDFQESQQFQTRAELVQLAQQEATEISNPNSARLGASIVYQEIERSRPAELLDLAVLILKLREDHHTTGEWNSNWTTLAKEQGLELDEERIQFNPKTGELRFDQNQFWPHSAITWKLQ